MMKIAFVHDRLMQYAGSERVLAAALEMYPEAPVFTLIHRRDSFEGSEIIRHPLYTSFLQRCPKATTKYWPLYLPLMPLAVETLDVGGYDVIISSNHLVAKGVLTRADQLHISYVHTPIRFAWDLRTQYLTHMHLTSGIKRLGAEALLHYLRLWDAISANRVDVFIANSHYVRRRIWKTYRRNAHVIYPPVEVERFRPHDLREGFYLTVSRLVPYKRADIIVRAFTRLGLPLIVIGTGPEFDKVSSVAGPTVTLLGNVPDDIVRSHLERCKAFVFCSDEDFGIVPVEAQAAGAPVIAYACGGVTETIIPGETGVLFPDQTVEALTQTVADFESGRYRFDTERIRKNAERFNKKRFQQEFHELVEREVNYFMHSQTTAVAELLPRP